ncbi:MAG TPA: hypothetical protein VFF30_19975, partial [Nitrososphaerales archaeon]|nr:hypothetical protein [Nitrososphaerales archaeon]
MKRASIAASCLLLVAITFLPAVALNSPSFGTLGFAASASSPIADSAATTIYNSTNSNTIVSGYQRHCFGLVQGRYWCFIAEDSIPGYTSSADGTAWSTPQSLPVSATKYQPDWTIGLWVDYKSSIVYLAYANQSSHYFTFDIGSLNSTGSISWSYVKSVRTHNYQASFPSVTLDSSHNVEVAVQTCSTSSCFGTPPPPRHLEVWKCLIGASGCSSWSYIRDINVGVPIGGPLSSPDVQFRPEILSLSNGGLALAWGEPIPVTPISIETCPAQCSNGSWSSPLTTAGNYSLSKSGFVAIGNTIYMGLLRKSSTSSFQTPCSTTVLCQVVFATYLYGSSSIYESSPFVTDQTLNTVNIATDGNNELVLLYDNSTTINHFVSPDLGQTWVSNATDVVGIPNPCPTVACLQSESLNTGYMVVSGNLVETWTYTLANYQCPCPTKFTVVPLGITTTTSPTTTTTTTSSSATTTTTSSSATTTTTSSSATTTSSSATTTSSSATTTTTSSAVGAWCSLNNQSPAVGNWIRFSCSGL